MHAPTPRVLAVLYGANTGACADTAATSRGDACATQGKYDDFHVEWYGSVGAMLVLAMIANIFSA